MKKTPRKKEVNLPVPSDWALERAHGILDCIELEDRNAKWQRNQDCKWTKIQCIILALELDDLVKEVIVAGRMSDDDLIEAFKRKN